MGSLAKMQQDARVEMNLPGCPRCRHPYDGVMKGLVSTTLWLQCYTCGHVETLDCKDESTTKAVLRTFDDPYMRGR